MSSKAIPDAHSNLISNKEKDYHVCDLKVFFNDPPVVDPEDVACRDRMEFFVESNDDHHCETELRAR